MRPAPKGNKRALAGEETREDRVGNETDDDSGVRGGLSVRDERCLGRFVSFNWKHGYGFVQTSDGEQWFVHVSQLEDVEEEEDLVGRQAMFTPGAGPKGKLAMLVKVGK